MEYWDTYTSERIKTGRTMVRGESFSEGEFHLIIHVCLFNKEGKMLIQQRQSDKVGWPNYWDLTAGGSATQGDTSQTAAQRELFEELGINIDLENIRPNLTVNFEKGFDDIYLVEKEITIDDLILQKEEVQSAKWATLEEIKEMILLGEFIPYHESFIELLFSCRNNYSVVNKEGSS